jgi:hypothetical protein
VVRAKAALFVSVLLLVAACTANDATTTSGAQSGETISVSNQGGELEGHTPTGFAGSGTGLFAGDNLNQSFPEGIGVQLFVTFALPADATVADARIVSDALHTSGEPFEDLGPLLAEPVAYQTFGPELFDLAAIGPDSECTVVDGTAITCSVTEAVQESVDRGDATAQFRIRFAQPADSDGLQDLAMFYTTDSNTNESGIFQLVITRDG